MRQATWFMRVIGVFYLLNLVLLWPPLWALQLPVMYPGVELHPKEPVFQILLDAWLVVGLGLAAIGAVLLWGARAPERYLGLVPVVLLTELLFMGWDVYSAIEGYEALWMAATTIVIHVLIIAWGWAVLRAARERAPATG